MKRSRMGSEAAGQFSVDKEPRPVGAYFSFLVVRKGYNYKAPKVGLEKVEKGFIIKRTS